jgi:hypothetical protein
MSVLTRSFLGVLSILFLPMMADATEMRLDNAPVRATPGEDHGPAGFPNDNASSTGSLRIGQTYAEVRALLQAHNPPARVSVQNRRFQLREVRTEPNVVTIQAEVMAPDRSFVERLKLRFTSKLSGQRLYFIHRDVEFRRAAQGNLHEFVNQMTNRFQGSTWSMVAPGYFSFRQIFTDGRMLSWGESQRRPELGSCFLLSGGPGFENALDESSLADDQPNDLSRCGGGIDADWRGDMRRFTVTLIDFPLFNDDRESLRNSLEMSARRLAPQGNRAQP